MSLHVTIVVSILVIVALSLVIAETIDRYYVDRVLHETFREKREGLLHQIDTKIRTMADFHHKERQEQQFKQLLEQNPGLLLLQLYMISPEPDEGLPLLVSVTHASATVPGAVPSEVEHAIAAERVVSTFPTMTSRDRVTLAAPISVGGRTVGAVFAEFWVGHLNSLINDHRRWSMIIRLFTGGLITAVLMAFIYMYVLRPIRKLRSAIESVTANDLPATVKVYRDDELGQLTHQFNSMLARVRRMAEENRHLVESLTQTRDELQEKVDEATTELIVRNEELVTINEQLLSAQREATRAQRLAVLGKIVATVAHKIGTPQTAISAHIQLLLENPALDPTVKDRLTIVLDQLDRMSRVIQDLLTYGRPPQLMLAPVSLNTAIEQTLNLFQPIFEDQRIELLTDLSEEIGEVMGDVSHLQEALGSLIENALDAMPDGGRLTIRTTRQLAPDAHGHSSVIIEIADTGHGIAPEYHQRMFEPFFTTKKSGRGTGLGLPIAYDIIKAHGWTLTVESREGRGTRFCIHVPRKREAHDV